MIEETGLGDECPCTGHKTAGTQRRNSIITMHVVYDIDDVRKQLLWEA